MFANLMVLSLRNILFFFLHFIILIPPGEPVIRDFVVSPFNPTEGAGLDFECKCCSSESERKIKHNFTGLFSSLFGDWEITSSQISSTKNQLFLESECGKSNDRIFLESLSFFISSTCIG